MELDNKEKINHPNHYNKGKYETIDIIDSILGDNKESYYVGNIVKYISRADYKNGYEDLEKAKWYLDRLVALKTKTSELKKLQERYRTS